MDRSFDPAYFDRHLDALMRIAESQSHSIHELAEAMRADHEAVMREIAEHTVQLRIDSEHINALTRIAEAHERRISQLEGDDESNGQ